MATKHEDWRAMMAAKQEEWWARMEEEVDTTFQEVFLEMSLMDSIRLLPWCISTTSSPGALPPCYMREALATAVQQIVEALMAVTVLESEGWQALVSTSSPAHQMETSPIPIPVLLNMPLIGTPPVGCTLVGLLINPQHTKWDHSPSVAPDDQPGKKNHA